MKTKTDLEKRIDQLERQVHELMYPQEFKIGEEVTIIHRSRWLDVYDNNSVLHKEQVKDTGLVIDYEIRRQSIAGAGNDYWGFYKVFDFDLRRMIDIGGYMCALAIVKKNNDDQTTH